jgi:hypothetical protein
MERRTVQVYIALQLEPALTQLHTAVTTATLPSKLVQARKFKQLGLMASGALLGSGLLISTTLDLPLPDLPELPVQQLAGTAALLSVAATAVGLKKLADDTMAVEFHNGRMYLQLEVPPRDGPTIPSGAILVLPPPP